MLDIPPQLNKPYSSLMYEVWTPTSQPNSLVLECLNHIREKNQISYTLQTPQERFTSLAETWKLNTLNSSSLDQIASENNYLQIISMGKTVLPLIFAQMQSQPDHWFVALNAITGVDPVKENNRGNLAAMTTDWLTWAKEHSYASYA